MKIKTIFNAIFYILVLTTPALADQSYSKNTESYVTTVPERYQKNLFELTHYITRPYGTSYEKARAIAYYIASHMRVNDPVQSDLHVTTKVNRKYQNPRNFFKTKVGNSTDFANLFATMCKHAGISVEVKRGCMARPGEKHVRCRKDSLRAWNNFMYKHKRIYVDVSMMATHFTENKTTKTDELFWQEDPTQTKIYAFNPSYFDFTYEQEKAFGGSWHVER